MKLLIDDDFELYYIKEGRKIYQKPELNIIEVPIKKEIKIYKRSTYKE